MDSPFLSAFQKFSKDPSLLVQRKHLTEAPDKPPPLPKTPPPPSVTIKKEYVAPYTPKATVLAGDKAKLSASGYSRSTVPDRPRVSSTPRPAASRSNSSRTPSRDSHNNFAKQTNNKPRGRKQSENEEEFPEIPAERRESSRRKAKDNLKSKIEAQEKMLLDENDPTFNNPALDLEDSDDDAEWNPLKDAEQNGGGKRKRKDSSDDDDEFNEYESFNAKFKMKKRAYSDQEVSSNKLLSAETQQDSVPEEEQEDIKVSSFLFLKIAVSQVINYRLGHS